MMKTSIVSLRSYTDLHVDIQAIFYKESSRDKGIKIEKHYLRNLAIVII